MIEIFQNHYKVQSHREQHSIFHDNQINFGSAFSFGFMKSTKWITKLRLQGASSQGQIMRTINRIYVSMWPSNAIDDSFLTLYILLYMSFGLRMYVWWLIQVMLYNKWFKVLQNYFKLQRNSVEIFLAATFSLIISSC
ncbi:hypothetical protein QVD17_35582 [Tagetes erecta]|uniref:Uncharacterized protein n=1 Tax=Tagetes erecta TaxID=13708 RepID=A0AAD8JZR2_TARER|nr:hypothetical protein QVD17_35582 [Tagetes erecta]